MHLFTHLTLIASLAVTLVSADRHGSKRNHAAFGFSKREPTGMSVFKRADNARFTYYAVQTLSLIIQNELTDSWTRMVSVHVARQTPLVTL